MSAPAEFNPYHKWLGISDSGQLPPDHYALLGISRFESDPEVISTAADGRMLLLRSFQIGKHSDLSQRLLNEVSSARVCLLNVDQKREYDARLKAEGSRVIRVAAKNAEPVAPVSVAPVSPQAPLRKAVAVKDLPDEMFPGLDFSKDASSSTILSKKTAPASAKKEGFQPVKLVITLSVGLCAMLILFLVVIPALNSGNGKSPGGEEIASGAGGGDETEGLAGTGISDSPNGSETADAPKTSKVTKKKEKTPKAKEEEVAGAEKKEAGVLEKDSEAELQRKLFADMGQAIPVVVAGKEDGGEVRVGIDVVHCTHSLPVRYIGPNGKPFVIIGGATYNKGLDTHAPCEVPIFLPKPAKKFTAEIGINSGPESGSAGTVKFYVFVRGKQAYRSDLLRTGDVAEPISVNLDGATRFTLFVSDERDSSYDQAFWVNATVHYMDGTTESLSDFPITIHTNAERVTPVAEMPREVLCSCSEDGTIKLWDAETGDLLNTLTGHAGRVRRCTFSPDGERLFSVGPDLTIHVCDVRTGREIKTFRGHLGGIESLEFSPDGKFFASGAADCTVRIWDAETFQETKILRGHSGSIHRVLWTPNGKNVISLGADATVRIWDLAKGKEKSVLKEHGAWIYDGDISRDGKYLVTGSPDGNLCLWYADLGKLWQKIPGNPNGSPAFSPDGQKIASGVHSGDIYLYEARSKKLLKTFRGHLGEVVRVVFSSDGKRLFSASDDRTIRIWDVESGKTIKVLTGHSLRVWNVSIYEYGAAEDGNRSTPRKPVAGGIF